MRNIEAIRKSISTELDELNSLMRNALSSDSCFLNNVIDNYLKRSGKQIRPILVILSAKVTGKINNDVILGAAAIELLHNASLIHDDVLDESAKRRGHPTINFLWDNQVAVLTGDYFVSRALKCATQTHNIAIVSILSALGTDLSLGEINQIDHARNHDISEQTYFEIIKRKTASLFKSCVQVGCEAMNADSNVAHLLGDYAELLGQCFQIRDDVFDYMASTDEVGKPTGNDLREGKVTLPLIHAIQTAPEPIASEMRNILGNEYLNENQIETLVTFAIANGGIDYACKKMLELRNQASEIAARLPQNDAVQCLEQIFDYTIERNF